ncbi:hypothetical protein [uncultured Pantoea sp.]|uniref:hypothetical protein n=1 Tax=uncultured Pantoea sp. TaxID=218084 RepID=UPI0025FAB1BA|nr:hypothetical protein [uncultured Pantoea sp.]
MEKNNQLIEHCREILAETENHEQWAVDMAIAALAHLEGDQSTRIPPPITEEEGYRLNTSWHAGAIFRDGANWMRDQVINMQAESADDVSPTEQIKPICSPGRTMRPHEFSQMVNELRDVPAVQSKRAAIVRVLHAFNITPEPPC